MRACADRELDLSLHASGALGPGEAAVVEAHVLGCGGCRAALDEARTALSLARLPEVSEGERRALAELPVRTLDALRAGERRAAAGKRWGAVALAAAAAIAVVLAPAALRKAPGPGGAAEVEAAAGAVAEAWEAPDVDELWEATAVLEWEDEPVAAGGDDLDGAAGEELALDEES